jgi:hypothetical protein
MVMRICCVAGSAPTIAACPFDTAGRTWWVSRCSPSGWLCPWDHALHANAVSRHDIAVQIFHGECEDCQAMSLFGWKTNRSRDLTPDFISFSWVRVTELVGVMVIEFRAYQTSLS